MRKFLLVFLMVVLTVFSFAGQRKKVALVLGGGGAKGVSHIGVLKVIEEAGIPIDYIAGTSMGAIVGGLYAIGYDAGTIDSLVQQQDWIQLLSDKIQRNNLSYPAKERSERFLLTLPFGMDKEERTIRGAIRGQNIHNLFSDLTIGYHDTVDFNQFHIPFACVAVDMVDGKEYVFHKGNLPEAMRASMAIPAVFTPVRIDSMVLVDGGINNNYPADVAVDMGADIIIGVDLGTSDLKTLQKLNTPGDVIGQIIALHGYEKYEENVERTDLLLRPNLQPYNAASFSSAALDTMIDRGEQEARLHWEELLALKQKIGISDTTETAPAEHWVRHPSSPQDSITIGPVSFEGIDPRDENWLKKISLMKDNRRIAISDLQKSIAILAGTNLYSKVNYRLTESEPYHLIVTVQKKSSSSINLGLRFDSEELVGLLVNATLDYRSKYQSRFAFTSRVGQRQSYAEVGYAIYSTLSRNINFTYHFDYNNLNFYSHGDKLMNSTYFHHLAEIGYLDMNWLGFVLNLGLRYEYYDYNSFLYNSGEQNYQVKPDGYFNYFIEAQFETLDKQYFPTKGVSVEAGYTVYTDNLLRYKNKTPFSAVNVGFKAVLPLNSRLSVEPRLYGRALFGDNIAYPYLNAMGGEVPGRFLPQQLPFAGVTNLEIINNSVVITGFDLRQRMGTNHYLSLIGDFALHNDDLIDIFDGSKIWGATFGYTYNSFLGPLGANIGYTNQTKKVQLYLNLGFYF